jgi:hypothetical protein
MRTLIPAIGLVSLLVALVTLALLDAEAPAGATGPGPGMALSAPAQAPVGQTFSITVSASPPPTTGNAVGFNSEIIFSAGAEWLPRATCQGEVLASTSGSPPPVCLSQPGPASEARHFVLTALFPPFPPLDSPVDGLLELDVRCTSAGVQTLVLTAVPGSPYGAAYFADTGGQANVKTVQHDIDGNTTMENVADVGTVTCLDEPTYTPSSTNTATVTPTATATPTATPDALLDSDGDGCSDVRELGDDALLGGLRDPASFWDFFDVPTPTRDGAVSALDMFAVLGRFNASGDTGIDPLSPPPSSGYHTAYDRGAVEGTYVWNLGAANGSIAATDIFGVLGQINHSCA